MDHAIFCHIYFAHYRLRQYLRHAHKKVQLICEKHLPTKYSGYATGFGDVLPDSERAGFSVLGHEMKIHSKYNIVLVAGSINYYM